MTNISVRKATIEDLPILLKFEQGVIAAERPFDPTIREGDINYYDLNAILAAENIAVFVALINDTIVGSGYARIEDARLYLKHKQHAYLGFMYVEPAYRGKGVNRAIINVITSWAKEKGITELVLDVYVDNEPAIKAYEKAGFKKHLIQMRMSI